MQNFNWLSPLLLTLKVAGLASLFALLLGILCGFAVSRTESRGGASRKAVVWLDGLLALPLVLPPTVLGYYLLVFIGKNGPLGRWLLETFSIRLIFTWQGAVIAAAIVAFPLVYRSARAAFDGVDRVYEDAARTLGASELKIFLRISLPCAWRGIMAGLMLAFARSMGEFGATLMVAGNMPGRTQTISLAIYDAVQAGKDYEATLLVLLVSIVCLLILVASNTLLGTNISQGVKNA